MDEFAFSLDDLPARVNHPGPTRRLTFTEAVDAIDTVVAAALPGATAAASSDRGMDAVTWRRGRRWATLRNVAPAVIAPAFGRPGDLRQLEPQPADEDTVTKLAWEFARYLAQP